MDKLLLFLLTIACFISCTSINEEKISNDTSILIDDLVKEHFQSITLNKLDGLLNNEKFSKEEKSFIKYYIYSFVDDPILIKYIEEKSIGADTTGVFGYLFLTNYYRNVDTVISLKYLKRAQEIGNSSVYLWIESYLFSNSKEEKNMYLTNASRINSKNEMVLFLNLQESIYNSDTIKYSESFNLLKTHYDNYYSNIIIADEYNAINILDSSKHYYEKSLSKKNTIGGNLKLSELYYYKFLDNYYGDYYLKQAEKISMYDEDVLKLKARIYFKNKDTLNSMKTIQTLVEKSPTTSNYVELMKFNLVLNRIESAETVLEAKIKPLAKKEEVIGYRLAIDIIKDRNSPIVNNKRITRVKNEFGIIPVEIANSIIEDVLTRHPR
jgi:hypothetical protein